LLLAQARRDELLSVVQLYSALGGGWESQTTNQISMTTDHP
jgi:outer membrane protein TolC